MRWILALQDASPSVIRDCQNVKDRLKAVREYRSKSKRKSTLAIADEPTRYNVEVIPTADYMAIPEVSSENRDYVPFGWLRKQAIPSNKLRILSNASRLEFGVLTSKAHMSWLSHVGGRLESRFQYGIGVVYNTFPWPDASDTQRAEIEKLAQAVLDARDQYPDSSLADLYDPDTMPPDLRRAHKALDKAVDRLYRKKPFDSDRERVEHLFGLYEKLVNPMSDADRQNKRTARNRARKK